MPSVLRFRMAAGICATYSLLYVEWRQVYVPRFLCYRMTAGLCATFSRYRMAAGLCATCSLF